MVRSGAVPVHLETMEPGAAYCVKAQTLVKTIGRHSTFSQAQCVKVQVTAQLPSVLFSLDKSPSSCPRPGALPSSWRPCQGEPLPLALALFAFVGFLLILVAVLLSIWKMGRLLRHSCCPVVVLPDTLKITSSPQKLISCRKEEVEVCTTAVLSSEELLRPWI
ncbi:Interleukin-20 Receptor Subunit Beta [Manis pentadactyla]|nr:Interleukin-20 Receptor Subunit Beta [Manis pentadactyla]